MMLFNVMPVVNLQAMPVLPVSYDEVKALLADGAINNQRDKRLNLEKPMSEEHRELIDIYRSSGLTVNGFASALSIPRVRLCSYLYVLTKTVPEDIMKRARRFQRGHMQIYKQTAEMPISDIYKSWCQLLEIEPDSALSLVIIGFILGGTPPLTIRRWRDNQNRPTEDRIARYDAIVNRLVGVLDQKADPSNPSVREMALKAEIRRIVEDYLQKDGQLPAAQRTILNYIA